MISWVGVTPLNLQTLAGKESNSSLDCCHLPMRLVKMRIPTALCQFPRGVLHQRLVLRDRRLLRRSTLQTERRVSDRFNMKAQRPHNNQPSGRQIDASVLISEALDHLTADQIAALSSDEPDNAVMSRIGAGGEGRAPTADQDGQGVSGVIALFRTSLLEEAELS